MYNIRRILLFVFGLFILSLGSVLSMRSGLVSLQRAQYPV